MVKPKNVISYKHFLVFFYYGYYSNFFNLLIINILLNKPWLHFINTKLIGLFASKLDPEFILELVQSKEYMGSINKNLIKQ